MKGMIVRETALKAWGNSVGIIIPKEDLVKEGLQIGEVLVTD